MRGIPTTLWAGTDFLAGDALDDANRSLCAHCGLAKYQHGTMGHWDGCTRIDYQYGGAILGFYAKDIPDDWYNSIAMAKVWDADRGEIRDLSYSFENIHPDDKATHHVMGPGDATDATLRAAETYLADRAAQSAYGDSYRDAAKIDRGHTIRVIAGRKIPIGTIATVFWKGTDQFDRTARYSLTTHYRLGLELADGRRLFTSESNCQRDLDDILGDMISWEDALLIGASRAHRDIANYRPRALAA